jgi:hypothetical protein
MLTLAAILPQFIERHLGWWLFGIILIIGVVVGLRDLGRLSFKRIWAISGVCWSESIRRRVLWITPLAILGVIIVSQLQRPVDELDTVRQTTKFSLFATGLLVAVTTIILACTNLPREIDNRVIYTVVTKPTTRLEIVLGKVIGFAKVSLAILVIMGLFTYGYLSVRAWSMRRDIATRLEQKIVPAASVATMEYYRDAGLLAAKKLETPGDLQIFSRVPWETGSRKYVFGGGEGSFLIPFDVTPELLTPAGGNEPGQGGLAVQAFVGYVRSGKSTTTIPTAATKPATTSPTTVPYYGPFIMSPEERIAIMGNREASTSPTVSIEVMDSNQNSIGSVTPLPPLKTFELNGPPNEVIELRGEVDERTARQMKGRVYLKVTGSSQETEYFIDLAQTATPALLKVVGRQPNGDVDVRDVEPARDLANPNTPAIVICEARSGTFGQQLRGGTGKTPTAVYRFRDADFSDDDSNAPFELRAGIERSGADETIEIGEEPTQVAVRIRNLTTQELSPETIVQPESNRTMFFRLPAAALAGGNFEVLMRCLTPGDYLGLQASSLVLITDRQSFAWNLAKSMLILWLMAILITTVAIFTSTFLSWPIAVVLTLVILLGHWGVQQLGDATQPGIGRQVVNDFNLRGSAKAEAISATVEKLSSFLNFISTILPDISKFPAVEDIERGIAIPAIKMRDAAGVALGFGLPLVLLAYVILKNKEVAP